MRQATKLLSTACLLLSSMLYGCATTTINSGLQAGELPPSGSFTAENGINFNVQPLTLATLPPKQVARSQPGSNLAALLQSSSRENYRIAPSDILSITLVSYPDITAAGSTGYPVDQQGYIQFPLIGRIKASGLSVPQFTSNLRARLQRYLRYPDPQVKIAEYRGNKFFIDGEVNTPGEFKITDAPVSLYSAISMAGGATDLGDSNKIVLRRNGTDYRIGLQSLQQMGVSANQIYIQDGDAIRVSSEDINKVYVLGEFGKVAPVPILDQGLNLAQVLGESAGLNSNTANAAKIYVVRDQPEYQRTNIYYVDMQALTSFPLASRFEMQPNDIVYVDPTGLTRWNRVISSLLPSTSAIRSFSSL
ncbi:polysaccharide biosynthesis/export family protein [Psychrobacter namhaensis]|uniref:polysaccharide biosynthesis/export family protein n=1 Tax=Psychrobacter namhaensis TaxID=292734 RepID=UPI0018DF9709|nr:polysaccharide biosynthesis/export family protein [Psychrobacter namhaensis]